MKTVYLYWKECFVFLLDRNSISKNLQVVILVVLLTATLAIRLSTIGTPAIDWTDWKEIDHIEISKNFVKNGFNFFSPEVTWPAEPPRATAMELPVVPYATALLYKVFGFSVYTVRMVPCASFLALMVFVFLLSRRELGPLVGCLSAMAAAVMPLYHPFGNILFSEPTVFAFSAGAIYYFACAIESNRRLHWALATLCFSMAVALKLEPLFLLLPIGFLSFKRYRFELKRYSKILISITIAMVLPILWYSYAYYLGKTSIDVFGVLGGHDKLQTFTMLTDPFWYRNMFGRFRVDILGGRFGSVLFGVGLISCITVRRGWLIFAYLIAVLCYFAIVAEGNIDTTYRQMNAVAPASIFVAIGTMSLATLGFTLVSSAAKKVDFRKRNLQMTALSAAFCILTVQVAINYNKIFFKSTGYWLDEKVIAEQIKKFSKTGDKLIVLGGYTIHKGGNDLSPVIYYYSGMQGWTLQKDQWQLRSVEELINKGAKLLGTFKMHREPASSSFVNQIRERYPVLFEDKDKDIALYKLK